jgi:LacI family transcriptional regulator
MTTSKDIARLANVSQSTVSRMLSGSTQVSPEVRQRILDAIEQTGYEPDIAARGLVKRVSRTIALTLFTDTIGLAFSKLVEPPCYFYLGILAAVEREVVTAEYDLLFPSRPLKRISTYVQSLKKRKVAGVIMIAPQTSDERIQVLLDADLPTVFLDAYGQKPHTTYVTADNISGCREAVEHLCQLGHRRIALLTGTLTHLGGTERLLGCQRAMAQAGLALDPDLIRQADWDVEEAYRSTLSLLDEHPDITAIIAASDPMAMGALRALHERGLNVPRDISLIGFDDANFSAYLPPPLTTVRPDRDSMGKSAVQALLSLIAGERNIPPIIVPTRLIVRASTGPARTTRGGS